MAAPKPIGTASSNEAVNSQSVPMIVGKIPPSLPIFRGFPNKYFKERWGTPPLKTWITIINRLARVTTAVTPKKRKATFSAILTLVLILTLPCS